MPPRWTVAPTASRRVGGDRRQIGAERVGERDVRDQAAAEERADAPLRAIEELVGHDDVERRVFVLEAADRARRDDALDAEHLEAVDVGAEVQLGRQDAVADAVPRQERHALAAQRADDVRPGRIAKRRRDRLLFAVGQLGHVVQAAAADDSDLDTHRLFERVFDTEDTKAIEVKTFIHFVSIVSSVLNPGRDEPEAPAACFSSTRTPWALAG